MSTARPLDTRHAVFPGTFDPVTLGHLDVVRRAAAIFARVTVAVATHPSKSELLTLKQRIALLHECCAGLRGVEGVHVEGLVIDACRKLGAGVIVRGIRNSTDFEYESQMARSNRAMAADIETVFLASDPEHSHISSTLVRQVTEMGGPLEPFVPPAVALVLRRR